MLYVKTEQFKYKFDLFYFPTHQQNKSRLKAYLWDLSANISLNKFYDGTKRDVFSDDNLICVDFLS